MSQDSDDAATIENLIADQRSTIAQLKKLWVNYKKTPKDRLSVGYVKARITALGDLWKQVQTNDRAITAMATEVDYQKQSYLIEDVYSQHESEVSEWQGILLDVLEKVTLAAKEKALPVIEEAANSNQALNKTLSPGPSSDVKLPRITIPKFLGDYKDWKSFHDLFESLIHKHSSLPAVQKLHYLKSSLGGEALGLIRHLALTEENYINAWEMLCTRYMNPRLLITRHVQLLLNQPYVQVENPSLLRRLRDHTTECLASLKSLKVSIGEWGPIIVTLIVQRLPSETRRLWEQERGASTEFPTIETLFEFLDGRGRALEATRDYKIVNRSPASKGEPKGKFDDNRNRTQAFHSNLSAECPCCGNEHTLKTCPKFKSMSPSTRGQFVKQKGLCFNCLANSHGVKNCPNKQVCFKCNLKHNTMLHINKEDNTNPHERDPKPSTSDQSPALQSFLSTQTPSALLATALVSVFSGTGESIIARALIDPGSQASFITTKVVQRLRLQKSHNVTRIQGLGQTRISQSNSLVNIQIASLQHPSFTLDCTAIMLPTLTGTLPQSKVAYSHWPHIHGLSLADPKFFEPGSIDLILGADVYAQIIQPPIKFGKPRTPIAQKTRLGWVLFGQLPEGPESRPQANSYVISCHSQGELNDSLKAFWEIEEPPKLKLWSSDETLCENIFQTSYHRNEEGRYVVKLPFTPISNNETLLGESRQIAVRRFKNLERKFQQAPELYESYKATIEEYLLLNHAEKVLPIPPEISPETYCYLPHHAIIKEESLTNKCRVVFDASCKTANGYSLNDRLLVGPPLQQDISRLLVNWRLKRFVFCADIEKMYRQILVESTDADFQRIIWRSTTESPLQDLRLRTVTFGTASAPFLAIRTLHQLASDEGTDYPRAAQVLRTETYVDDVYSGSDCVEEALSLQRELISLLSLGKFRLHKWAANCPDLIKNVNHSDRSVSTQAKNLNLASSVKTLGINWSPGEDHFSFKIRKERPQPPFTKRQVLSYIASLYDPLGWVSPVIIRAKIFIQTLWQSGLSWDEVLSDELATQWVRFLEVLPTIERVTIPRWIEDYSIASIQVHGFCDASERAYAAVIYIRLETATKTRVFLLASKTRVAPVKPVTLPRLELCGAVLLSQLMHGIREDLVCEDSQVYTWTDSTIVLSWLRKPPNSFKTFVSNRIVTILDNIGASKWRHVPSAQNPADLGSRGILGEDFANLSLWWTGPTWLQRTERHWPPQKIPKVSDAGLLEMRPIKSLSLYANPTYLLEVLSRFSSLRRLFGVTSYVFRFINACQRKPVISKDLKLVGAEIEQSRKFWCRTVQHFYFEEEVQCLSQNKTLAKHSKIRALCPFLDSDGLLRVGGRLENSTLSYDERHPVLLPNSGYFTELIVKDAHRVTLHGGPQLMQAYVRQRYWIVRSRNLLKRLLHQCTICFRFVKNTQSQLMANLPRERVTISRPFTYVGIDYTGFLNIKMCRGRGNRFYKGYVVVFVCLCIKAIHLEVVGDLTTASFLAALRRFIARRGLCKRIFSDNGTNFIGAKAQLEKELKAVIKQAEREATEILSHEGVDWSFIPPSSPHFGGLWEAGVKSFKFHFKRLVGNSTFVYEELVTLTTQIEGILNSRPLCPLSEDIQDLGILTPAHFLIGSPMFAPPEEDLCDSKTHTLDRWQHIQRIRQHFWHRWSTEYLSRLQQRPKWCKPEPNVSVGDLVLIKDERLPPLKWKLGRVVKTHPGKDSLVRVVTVKTTNSEIQRPIAKICILPWNKALT